MYKLYFTNKEFAPHGISKEKVPLLIKEDIWHLNVSGIFLHINLEKLLQN